MISTLLIAFLAVSAIDGKPYSFEREVRKLLQRRGPVCDANKAGSVAFVFDSAAGTDNIQDQKDYAIKVANFLPTNGKVSVAGLVYGGPATTVLPLGSETTYDGIKAAINGISADPHGPRDEADALEKAMELLAGVDGEKAVILFVDGPAENVDKAKAAVQELDSSDVSVFFAFPYALSKSLLGELKEVADQPYSLTLNAMNSLGLAESIGIEFDVQYQC